MTVGSALAVVHQVCEALVAVLIGVVVDEAVRTGDGGRMALWLGVLVVVFGVLAVSAMVGYYRLTTAEARTSHDLRVRLAARAVDPRGGTEQVASSGALLSLATSDAGRVGAVTHVIGGGTSAALVLLAGLAWLLVTAWELGAVVLVGLPAMVLAAQWLARPLLARSATEQAAVAQASGVAVDLVRGLRVLKGLGAEDAATRRYRAVSVRARDRRIAAARWTGVTDGAVLALAGVLVVAVAWVGGRLALSGSVSVGQLVAAVGLAAFLVGPLERLVALPADLAVVRASADRLAAVLEAVPPVEDGVEPLPPGPSRELALHGVVSGTLTGLELTVAPGSAVGVVAPDAQDAHSLLDVLARRVDPASGTAAYAGRPLPALRLTDLHRAVLVADHDAPLFEGTVGQSLGAASPAVLEASGADEVLRVLPDGLAAEVGERGSRLSGGQRQRVALARALAADPEVLVLHDPTTAVDAATEHRIAERLRAVRASRTTVLVTTSPALLAACDRVVLLRGGAVVADSRHEALSDDPAYRSSVLT